MRQLIHSFGYAVKGLVYCIRGERNFRIHLTAMVWVLLASLFFSLSAVEYAVLTITFALVIGAEMVNTAIEVLVNIEVEGYHRLAKSAKDVAAGFVLLCAVFAVIVGVLIFAKPAGWMRLWDFFCAAPVMIIPVILLLALSLLFIFKLPRERRKKAG